MNNKSIISFIKTLPKLDLHCHLDGSLPIKFVADTLESTDNFDALANQLQAPLNCSSLAEYLTCFDLPISCLNSRGNITNAVLATIKEASMENIKYIELRFAPALSESSTLSLSDIIEAAIIGTKLGFEKYKVYSNIIICAMRHHSLDTNIRVLKSALDFYNKGVCALDLAGDEAAFSNILFVELFKYATKSNMPFTIHSGECGSAENVKLAMELGAKRIGHGIAMNKDLALIRECSKKGIGIELCPTSNYQTKAIKEHEEYPLNNFLKNGILATINTDNRTVSSTTIENEFRLITEQFCISEEDLVTLTKNSIEISFANDNIKNELINSLLKV